MKRFRYTVNGSAANGQTWETNGSVVLEASGEFPRLVGTAMRESFMQLTRGEAVFGQPGVGCTGPYEVWRFILQEETFMEDHQLRSLQGDLAELKESLDRVDERWFGNLGSAHTHLQHAIHVLERIRDGLEKERP